MSTDVGRGSGVVGDPEIAALEEELRAAQLAGDVAALDRLIADDLLFTGPDGQLATKAQDLASHASGAVRFREHQPEELRIWTVNGDVRVVSLRTRLVVEVSGTEFSGTYRYTRVWARENNGPWRIAAGHVSAVGPSS